MQKFENFKYFLKNCLNSSYKTLEEHSITSINNAVTYYQTLEEVPWLLRLEKPKNFKKFQKLFYKKLLKLVILKS